MPSGARNNRTTAWWTGVLPGVAMVATVLWGNVIGARLREVLEPSLRAH